jgi:CheY-like chemotaxis protein
VLVVDDEASLRSLLQELLQGAGYKVVVAENGAVALHLARYERPAVVLTDFSMPGLDGPTLIRRLRSHPETRHIPIIAMSATRPPRKSLGDVPFIEKPFDLDDVLATIALHTSGPMTEDSSHATSPSF